MHLCRWLHMRLLLLLLLLKMLLLLFQAIWMNEWLLMLPRFFGPRRALFLFGRVLLCVWRR